MLRKELLQEILSIPASAYEMGAELLDTGFESEAEIRAGIIAAVRFGKIKTKNSLVVIKHRKVFFLLVTNHKEVLSIAIFHLTSDYISGYGLFGKCEGSVFHPSNSAEPDDIGMLRFCLGAFLEGDYVAFDGDNLHELLHEPDIRWA